MFNAKLKKLSKLYLSVYQATTGSYSKNKGNRV